VRSPAAPARFPGIEEHARSPAPALGADTAAVLAELGYSEEEIGEMTHRPSP
ncbi:carnitine dehydratase, partial [Caulobacter sp. D4A]